jgi:hypothetical protein
VIPDTNTHRQKHTHYTDRNTHSQTTCNELDSDHRPPLAFNPLKPQAHASKRVRRTQILSWHQSSRVHNTLHHNTNLRINSLYSLSLSHLLRILGVLLNDRHITRLPLLALDECLFELVSILGVCKTECKQFILLLHLACFRILTPVGSEVGKGPVASRVRPQIQLLRDCSPSEARIVTSSTTHSGSRRRNIDTSTNPNPTGRDKDVNACWKQTRRTRNREREREGKRGRV